MASRFEWRLWPTLGTVAGLALLVSLGSWQTSRYVEKTERSRIRETRMERDPVEIGSLSDLSGSEMNYRRVRVNGTLDASTTFVFRHRFYEGNPGVWVVHPLTLTEGGGEVLVNRGWVPMQKAERALDELPPPGDGPFKGIVYELPQVIPEEGMRRKLTSGEATLAGETTWWNTFDVGGIYEHLGAETPERPLVVVLGETHGADPHPIASVEHTTESYLTPGRHLSYALFWFAVAVALLGMYVAAGFDVLKSERRGKVKVEGTGNGE